MQARVTTRASRSRWGWWGLWLALAVLLFVGVGGAGGGARAYSRAAWGGFIDEDRNCRDTRQEVLIRDSLKPVLWREDDRQDRHCEVAWGEWRDPWSGEVLNDPMKVDIDHHVPLAEAHRSGGSTWNVARRRAYANDLAFDGHLRALSAHTNRQKGDKGPARWRPARKEAWCLYAKDWSLVKLAWGLQATEAERLAIREMGRTCRDPSTPTLLDRPAG